MEENAVIFANGHVVTCDAAHRAGKFHVVVRDGRIQEIGGLLEVLTTMYPSASVVDLTGKIILPGFVNAHFHPESVLLSELTTGKPFSAWARARRLQSVVESLVQPAHEQHLGSILRATYAGHVKSGTTCLGEYPPAVDARGFGLLLREGDASGVRIVSVLQNWDQIDQVREFKNPRIKFLVGLGSEEAYTVYSFENFVRAAREMETGIAAHIGEQKDDVDILRRNFSKAPATLLRDFGALLKRTVLIHMNHGGAEDALRVAEAGAHVAVCPLSALHKQTGYPFFRALAKRPVRLCIGTDWGSVDMLAELRFLRDLPHLFASMPGYSALQLLRMATINGAAALGIGEETGSIEVGKQADLLVVEGNDLRLDQPGDDWSAEKYADYILRLPAPLTPVHVMIAGAFAVKDSVLVGTDERECGDQFRKARAAIVGNRAGEDRKLRVNADDGAVAKPRIFSFGSGDRGVEKAEEGYVNGIAPVPLLPAGDDVEARHEPAVDESPADVPSRAVEERVRPGHVKKVFGEDDVA